jgi:hypothetical protein
MDMTISPEERDALYNRLLICLTGIDDVYTAVQEENWERAQDLGEEFSDLLRLACSDLGWGGGRQDAYPLQTPPEVLRRAVTILREAAGKDRAHFEKERDKVSEEVDDARNLEEICERILAGLGQGR